MVSEDLLSAGVALSTAFLQKAFSALRPFGGVACLPVPKAQGEKVSRSDIAASLPNGRLTQAGPWLLLRREGALPGSANWTHEHADAANTRVARDRLVKAPLGLLWFGGTSHQG